MENPPSTGGVPPASRAPSHTMGRRWGGTRWLPRDPYTLAAWLVFVCIVIGCWTGFTEGDEDIYFLGSRRIADPGFLSLDFTWSRLPPTSALFDHLLAPLWAFFDAFTIATLGRLIFWALMAWSIVLLARTIRIAWWSVVVGFALWLLWGQTLAECGAPFIGFQVKSLAYPLLFFALTFAIRGQLPWAGMAVGLATAFHIIIGGWACLALFLSLLVNRRMFSFRQVGIFLLSTAPFIGPLLFGVSRFFGAPVSHAEQARMDEIYVRFAMPSCCDMDYFMTRAEWIRAAVVFTIAPVVVFAWPDRRAAKILGAFIVSLVLLFAVGVLAWRLNLYGLLKLYPFQLANALPALFLFVFVAGWIGLGGATRRLSKAGWALVLIATIWLGYDREVVVALVDQPRYFINEVEALLSNSPMPEEPLYDWIRKNTPRSSVFITPYLSEFWPYAERAQVASMRHPPLDRRLIEWKDRLEALNGFHPYTRRGYDVENELAIHEGRLSIQNLVLMRQRYGATHFLIKGERRDLGAFLLHSESGYSVYDVTGLGAGEGGR